MITVNIEKAKAVAHEIRRAKRSEELAPLDKVIALQLPNSDVTDADRQAVRDVYAEMQSKIDKAKSVDEIKQALGL